MLPQRKQYDPAPTAPAVDEALELSSDWIYHGDAYPPAGREPITSPARMLHHELQMRLGDLVTPGIPAVRGGAVAAEAKWPMTARIATIVTISSVLWAGIYVALVRVIAG